MQCFLHLPKQLNSAVSSSTLQTQWIYEEKHWIMTPRIPDTYYEIFNLPMSTESTESPEIYIYESFEDPNAHRFAPDLRLSSYSVSARLHEINFNPEDIDDEAIVDCPSNARNFIYQKSSDYGYGWIFSRDVAFALIFFICGCLAITLLLFRQRLGALRHLAMEPRYVPKFFYRYIRDSREVSLDTKNCTVKVCAYHHQRWSS